MFGQFIGSIFQFITYLFSLFFGNREQSVPSNPTIATPIPDTEVQRLYNIDLVVERRFESTDPTWETYFQSAKNRWEEIIVGDVSGGFFLPTFGPLFCDLSISVNFVEDIFMCAVDTDIDGQGGILGSAGPVLFWPNGRTSAGAMKFDSADVNNYISRGQFESIVLHEMGHLIGMGTLWDDFGLNDGQSALYTGANAIREWELAGCTEPLKVETDGRVGTRFFHWDEDCMKTELMTGQLAHSAPFAPISRITGGSLQDMGYEVDMSALDKFDSSQINPLCCFGDNVFLRKPDTKPKLSDEGHLRAQQYVDELVKTSSIPKGGIILSNFTLVHMYEVMIEEDGQVFSVNIQA